MKNYYKIQIDETGRSSLKEEKETLFNTETQKVKTLEEVTTFIINRYGKIPGKRRKIYIDENGKMKVVGFLHSFWNMSHGNKWYQTDWITISKVKETPILI